MVILVSENQALNNLLSEQLTHSFSATLKNIKFVTQSGQL